MIGGIKVTAILDSFLEFPSELMRGVSVETLSKIQLERRQGSKSYVTINCFLIETGDAKILVDTGFGGPVESNKGRLPVELSALGFSATDITHIFLTHLHADHAGGVLDEAGKLAFPNARLIAHKAEREFWMSDPPPAGDDLFDIQLDAARKLLPLVDTIDWVDEGIVLPSIELMHLPGHTPGHSGYRVFDAGASMLIWGDIVHQPYVQLRNPEIGVAFDVDPELAVATRKRIVDHVASDAGLIAGMHLDFPAFGRLKTVTLGEYEFVPLIWSPTALPDL
jgi:glyoxylase-like metal-dependent hydrolase (beta-lactamase superfamily II)